MSTILQLMVVGVFLLMDISNAQNPTLVFRIVNESTTSAYNTYMTAGRYGHPNNFTDHFKSEVIDNWESYGITKVNVSIKVGHREVFYLHFDVKNTNKISWFSIFNLVRSFPDVDLYATYFRTSLNTYGKHFKVKAENSRIFVVNNYYNNCPHDVGWLMVFDTPQRGTCPLFEPARSSTKVTFMFSPEPRPIVWQQLYMSNDGRADYIEIYANPNITTTATTTDSTTTSTTTAYTTTTSTTTTDSANPFTTATGVTTSLAAESTTSDAANTVATKSTTTSTTAPDCVTCACLHHMENITKEELAEVIKQLKEELTVDKTKTSASIRRKISANDSRTSAKALGSVGAAILAIPFVFIILCDMINLVRYFNK